MPRGGARGQNLEHLRFFLDFLLIFFFDGISVMFLFEQQILFRVSFLSDFRPWGSMLQGGARGQNLGHLSFFSIIFLVWNHSF